MPSPLAGGEVLRVEGLHTYIETDSGVVRAVDDVSFSLRQGEILGLVGESGSGKSVTCRTIDGVDAVASGAVDRDRPLRGPARDGTCSTPAAPSCSGSAARTFR